jgi:hypothetical protein
VGIEDAVPLKADVYPVPNEGLFNVLIIGRPNSNVTIEIFNSFGSRIISKEFRNDNGRQTFSIDIRPAPSGVYFVRISDGNSVITRKLIKQ